MKAIMTVVFAVDVPEGTDLPSLYLDIPTGRVNILSLKDGRPVGGATIAGYETLGVDDEEGVEDVQECGRCGGLLDGQGLCMDATCPFAGHEQECPAGWSGHREHAAGPCTCGGWADAADENEDADADEPGRPTSTGGGR